MKKNNLKNKDITYRTPAETGDVNAETAATLDSVAAPAVALSASLPDTRKRVITALKISGLVALVLLFCYLVYGVAGSLYGWQQQPLFTSTGGVPSRSYGFLVVACVFAVLAFLNLVAGALYCYFFFIRAKRRNKTPTQQS